MILLFEDFADILPKYTREKPQFTEFEASIPNIPLDGLKELPVRAAVVRVVFLVQEWYHMKISLTNDVVGNVEES